MYLATPPSYSSRFLELTLIACLASVSGNARLAAQVAVTTTEQASPAYQPAPAQRQPPQQQQQASELPSSPATPPASSATTFELPGAERVEYRQIGGVSLQLHIFRPPHSLESQTLESQAVESQSLESQAAEPPRAAILFFFGGGWSGGTPLQFAPQCQALAARGMVAVSAEYRVRNRHGVQPWDCVADAKAAVRYVREHADELGIDRYRIAVGGGSAGGHLALCTATVSRFKEEAASPVSAVPDALVLFNPVVDTTQSGYGANRFGDRAQAFSPAHQIQPRMPPTLILHGTADSVVPLENVQRFSAAMRKAGNACQLITYPGAEHGFFNAGRDTSAYADTLERTDHFLTGLGFLQPRGEDLVAGRSLAAWELQLQDDNPTRRLIAARQLGAFGIAGQQAFAAMLDHPDPSVRYWGASHLGNIDPVHHRSVFTEAQTARLMMQLQDPVAEVRLAAAYAMCRTPQIASGLQLLQGAIDSPERGTACAAADFLGRVGPPALPVAESMRGTMKRHQDGGDYHVARALKQALRLIEHEQALDDSSRPAGGPPPRGWSPANSSHTAPESEASANSAKAGSHAAIVPTATSPRADPRPPDPRPNILWISCEDISPNLGCYGDAYAATPHLDQLAREGTRFTHAFTPAGVCAVVRSGVITGIYPISLGSQHMRSLIVPPAEVKCFTEYLRGAGYFCTNNSKTDYQFAAPFTAWDRQGDKHGDWRDRAPGQPFFSVINLTCSHESQIRHGRRTHQLVRESLPPDRRHDPDLAEPFLPPIHPNTPEARTDWAWYADNISDMDRQVGLILAELEKDGLADDTVVLFWSDHGRGLPRGKRWIYDSGVHIPLIVRWPRQLVPGSERHDFVSTQDLPATMLALADITRPSYMQGRVFLGNETEAAPAFLFFHRDRMDEACETMRGLRDQRYKYIRNFEPERTYLQHLDYMDQMPTLGDMRRWYAYGQLTFAQGLWFRGRKPVEELYDLVLDPHETVNLCVLPEHSERLAAMRAALETWMVQMADRGMLPEPIMMEQMRRSRPAETTAPPRISFERLSSRHARVTLSCDTPGASLAYRIVPKNDELDAAADRTGTAAASSPGERFADWRLYTAPFDAARDELVEARACRLGIADSPLIRTPWPQE